VEGAVRGRDFTVFAGAGMQPLGKTAGARQGRPGALRPQAAASPARPPPNGGGGGSLLLGVGERGVGGAWDPDLDL